MLVIPWPDPAVFHQPSHWLLSVVEVPSPVPPCCFSLAYYASTCDFYDFKSDMIHMHGY